MSLASQMEARGRKMQSAFAVYKKMNSEEHSTSETQKNEGDKSGEMDTRQINGSQESQLDVVQENKQKGKKPKMNGSEPAPLSHGDVNSTKNKKKKKRRSGEEKKKKDGMKVGEAKKPKKRKIENGVDTNAKKVCGADELSSSVHNGQHHDGDISRKNHDSDSFFHTFNPERCTDSRDTAMDLFKLLIGPLSPNDFFSEYWEKKPTVVHRKKPHYNDGWFSTTELDSILREQYLEFSTNVDLTSYVDGVRKTHNPTGRAVASTVWEHFQDGCSVRLLNPQTFSRTIWLLNSTLQELFNSCMGANVYLTPAGSQGFSPHYDDIEAFVMQIEGKKRWRLYQPRHDEETLPRFSSRKFAHTSDVFNSVMVFCISQRTSPKLTIGEPFLEVVLEAGDLLYFPRGTIHQAETLSDGHSLHITLSTFQKHSWADLMGELLPAALEIASVEDVEFRTGLPVGYLGYTGIVNSDLNDKHRDAFFKKISLLFSKLCNYAPVDAAVDQMGANYIHDCLPPFLTEREVSSTVKSTGSRWAAGGLVDGIKLTGDTEVKIIRHGAMRLVMEKEAIILYYSLHNTRLYHEKDPVGMEIQEDDAPGVEYLLQSYPNFVRVDSIPIQRGSTEDKIDLCFSLHRQGLLLTVQSTIINNN